MGTSLYFATGFQLKWDVHKSNYIRVGVVSLARGCCPKLPLISPLCHHHARDTWPLCSQIKPLPLFLCVISFFLSVSLYEDILDRCQTVIEWCMGELKSRSMVIYINKKTYFLKRQANGTETVFLHGLKVRFFYCYSRICCQ